jgi:hypothetical protein
MMAKRPILHSEFMIIQSAYANAAVKLSADVSVVKEEYTPSQIGKSRLFNADFSLWLLPDLPKRKERKVEVVPVRPHSIGAEYFVTIRNDGAPALVELIGGESIPLDSFSDLMKRVDSVVTEIFRDSCKNATYLRLAELATGVSFLAAKMHIEELTCLPPEQMTLNKGQVFIRRLDGQPVMIDGFLEDYK